MKKEPKKNISPLKKNNFKKRKRSFFVLVIIIIISILIYTIYDKYKYKTKRYTHAQEMYILEYEHNMNTKYTQYLDGIIRYTKDGAVAISSEGKLIWNLPYEIQEGVISQKGSLFAIANRGGKEIYIINKKGDISTIKTEYEINDIEIASQGVVAALMSNKSTNYINVYDINGTKLVSKEIDIDKYGYAIDIGLSEDGTKLAISFMSIKTGVTETKLMFYNYGESGKEFPNKFVGGIDFDNVVIPRVKFINSNKMCAFTDKGFVLYSIIQTPEEIFSTDFDDDIKSIVFNSEYIGFVLEKGSNEGRNQIILYNMKGDKVLDLAINYEYENIVLSENDIILQNSNSYLIYDLKGRKKIEQTIDGKINFLYPSKLEDRFFLIKNSEITHIKLGK